MQKRFSFLTSFALATLALSCLFAFIHTSSIAQPTEVWVDDDYDPGTPGWQTTHFDKIQDGIDAVASAGTVNVLAGDYIEYLTIGKPLGLNGAGCDSVDVFYAGGSPDDAVVDVDVDSVDINGIEVHMSYAANAAGTGILIAERNFVTVDSCCVSDFSSGGYGIVSYNSNTITLTNNLVGDTGGMAHMGIYHGHAPSVGGEGTGMVTGNTVFGTASHSGIYFGMNVMGTISENTVYDCVVGIFITEINKGAVTVSYNNLSDNTYGIYALSNKLPLTIEHNDLTDNGTGIYYRGSGYGQYTYAEHNTITGGTVGVWCRRYGASSWPYKFHLFNNTITGASEDGIRFEDPNISGNDVLIGGNLGHSNTIKNHGNYNVRLVDYPYDIDATYNDWGVYTLSDIEDLIWHKNDDSSLGLVHYGDYVAVELSSFTALAKDKVVILKWVTQSEVNNLGFHIHRSQSSESDYVKLNSTLIPGASGGSSDSPHEYTYIDRNVTEGKYFYKLTQVDFDGKTTWYGPMCVTLASVRPSGFTLHQAYPNPFNSRTNISFVLPEAVGRSTLIIYNVRGEKIKTLIDDSRGMGLHTIFWDGTDHRGGEVASGIYFYILEAGCFHQTNKMVLMR